GPAVVSAIDPASANRRATGALVSIVIPCYKQARFLADAIESALAQTYRTIEIVVVNDGSPDETAAVAARYPPVRYIEQDNAGMRDVPPLGARRDRRVRHARRRVRRLRDVPARQPRVSRRVSRANGCRIPSSRRQHVAGRAAYAAGPVRHHAAPAAAAARRRG